jgi:hypothetical protein
MNLNWKHNLDLSAVHAAWCLSTHRADCRKCSEDLEEAASVLASCAARLSISPSRLWDSLFVLCVDTPDNRGLAERVIIRCVPPSLRSDLMLVHLANAIATLESRFARDYPNFKREMQLRTGPLQQQWEAYGPGLLRLIGQYTDEVLIVEEADVVLVQPILGGAGYAHLSTNRCHIEAVLTNIDSHLTEPIRLAWLLSQVEFEKPVYSDLINAFRLREISGLAMLPPTLKAAEELGLCSFRLDSIQQAIELWRLAEPNRSSESLAEIVITWWETVEASQPEWRTALTGLDRMLG